MSVDRIACAWSMERYMNEETQFVFAPNGQLLEQKKHAFDAPEANYSHKGGNDCFPLTARTHSPWDKALLMLTNIADSANEVVDMLPPTESYLLKKLCIGTLFNASDNVEALIQGLYLNDVPFCYVEIRQRNYGDQL